MVKGIGIDLVNLGEFRRICEGFSAEVEAPCPFVARTFTAAELAQARQRRDACEFLAGRFAAKEAVFKALASLTAAGFDLRAVETIDAPTGEPRVTVAPGCALAPVLAEAGCEEVLVSITNEGDYVAAVALAQ